MDKVKFKIVDGKEIKITYRSVPDHLIPTHLNPKKGKFQFYSNPSKDVTANTIATYRTQLNNLARSTGIDNNYKLIKNSKQALEYYEKLKPSVKPLFLSAVFYELNQPNYNKEDMVPYYKALQPIKIAQVKASIERSDSVEEKLRLTEMLNKMVANYNST
jgi:hypothetical protein